MWALRGCEASTKETSIPVATGLAEAPENSIGTDTKVVLSRATEITELFGKPVGRSSAAGVVQNPLKVFDLLSLILYRNTIYERLGSTETVFHWKARSDEIVGKFGNVIGSDNYGWFTADCG